VAELKGNKAKPIQLKLELGLGLSLAIKSLKGILLFDPQDQNFKP
jgi:hypothetical protein